jgi:hypothetical protein
MRRPLLALLAAAAASALGCLQADEQVVLMPDGSGKITMTIAVKKQILTLLDARLKELKSKVPDGPKLSNPFEQFTGADSPLVANAEGVAAWSLGRVQQDGEWVRTTVVGYFDDINQVRIYSEDNGPDGPVKTLVFQARLAKTPSGWSLLSSNEKRKDLRKLISPGREDADVQNASLDLMKPMLQEMKLANSVVVPGAIKDAVGFFSFDGRRASTSIDGPTLVAAVTNPEGEEHRKLLTLGATSDIRLSWSTIDVSDAEVAAFKQEAARAKQAWAAQGGRPLPKAADGGPDASKLTDDEVNRLFIGAQVKAAKEHLRGGSKAKAKAILESVIKDYPNEKATLEARALLDQAK